MTTNITLFVVYVFVSSFGLFKLKTANGVIGTQFVGYVFLNETLQLTHIGGIGFLLLGIFMIFHNA